MKVLIFMVVLCLSSCLAEYNKDQMREILDISRRCFQKLNIPNDSDIVQRLAYKQNVTYSKEEMDFVRCFQIDFGMYDTVGNIRADTLINFFMKKPNLDRKQVTEFVNLCIDKCNDLGFAEKPRCTYDCVFKNKQVWLE